MNELTHSQKKLLDYFLKTLQEYLGGQCCDDLSGKVKSLMTKEDKKEFLNLFNRGNTSDPDQYMDDLYQNFMVVFALRVKLGFVKKKIISVKK